MSNCHLCQLNLFCSEDNKCAVVANCAPLLTNRRLKLKRGESLSFPASKCEYLYAIQYGAMKTFENDANGRELIRGFYFVGEVLGYEAIHTKVYPFSAAALCETEVCEIPFASVLELLNSKPPLQKHILDLLSQQLTSGLYFQVGAEQRVAAFLMDMARRLRADQHLEFHLPMSREDIGNYLRLSTETVSRICSRLNSAGIIKSENKKISLLDMEALRQISSGLVA